MSAEAVCQFIDANVLVYAFDPSAKTRHTAAVQLLEELWAHGTGCTSVQVLQEFFVIITRKVARPLSIEDAADRVRDLTAWKIFAPTAHDVLSAIALHTQAKISFWDAMVVHAAAELGCNLLWTEDLKHGQVIRGVRVRNPFSEQRQRSD